MVRRRTTKTVQKIRPAISPCAKAKQNRAVAKVVIGKHKFAAKVSCKGRVSLTRTGRKAYNAEKRKVKCACSKKAGTHRRVRTGSKMRTKKPTTTMRGYGLWW